MASPGSILFSFEEKAVFTSNAPYDKDKVFEAALENDIDEIDFVVDNFHDSGEEGEAYCTIYIHIYHIIIMYLIALIF